MYIKKYLRKRLIISSITIMLLIVTIISSSYAIFMDSKTDIKEQVLTVGDLLITYTGGSAINSNGITPLTDEVAYQKIDNVYTFTIKNEGPVPYKYKIYLEDNPSFLDRDLLNHNYIRYDLNNEGTGILGEKEGGIIFEGVLKGNTTKEYTLRLWVGIEGLPNSAIGSEIHLNIMVDGRAEDGIETKKLRETLLAEYGGAEAIVARGNPDFSKISPEVISTAEEVFRNQIVSMAKSKASKISIGTGYTYNDVTRTFSITGIESTTFDDNIKGKYLCFVVAGWSSNCPIIYKILDIHLSETENNYEQDLEGILQGSFPSSANKMVATSYTFDSNTGLYNLSGTKYTNVSYNSSYINYYTCNTNADNCGVLFKIVSVSGSNMTGISYYTKANYNYITKADVHRAAVISTEDAQGLYATEDEYGMSFYFRGAKDLLKNNLIFAGFQWKIVRINGDGSIRLIYNGECSNNKCEINDSGALTQIKKEAFNAHSSSPLFLDAKYLGYMYGGAINEASISRNQATTNETDSTAKIALDNWYQNNLANQGNTITSKIIDNIFCNDRQLQSEAGGGTTGTGFGNSTTGYAASYRLSSKTPTLRCGLKNDRFTVNDTLLGNGMLTYPVGLISVDEVLLSGATASSTKNPLIYLYTSENYWTMSPRFIEPENACVNSLHFLDYEGYIQTSGVQGSSNNSFGLRPIISVARNVLVSGSGSLTDPYIVH